MEEYINLFENIIAKTSKKVDYMDIRFGKGNNTSILMKDGNVDEINTGMSLGARIRVLNNGAWGFAYTTDLSKINEITETALKLSSSLKGDISLSESPVTKDKVEIDVKIPFKDISIEEKKDIMKEAAEAATIEKVNSTTASYVDSEVNELFMNSDGSEIQIKTSRVRMALNASATDGEIIQFGHGSLGGVKGFEIIKDADIEEFARMQKAVNYVNAFANCTALYSTNEEERVFGLHLKKNIPFIVQIPNIEVYLRSTLEDFFTVQRAIITEMERNKVKEEQI